MHRNASLTRIAFFALVLCLTAVEAKAVAIRELVGLHGAVPIPLEGIGIVTGLAGTGDKKGAAQELLRKYLGNNNFDFEISSLATGNIALVRVKAEMQPFSRPSNRIAVSVSSIGDARSLEGGELLSCDLFDGFNEFPVARATGQVVVGTNVLTRGTIPAGPSSGALQLGVYPFGNVVNNEGVIRLNLMRANWADAAAIARQINQTPYLNPNLQETTMFADPGPVEPVAYAKDAGQVYVKIPEIYRYQVSKFIADMLDVPITVDRPARILVNRAKNSIVVSGDIRVNKGMASIQDRTVTVRPGTPDMPPGYVLENETPRNLIELEGPGSYADLQGLIDTMNAMGLTTAQVITLFEQLHDGGVINAEFINQ